MTPDELRFQFLKAGIKYFRGWSVSGELRIDDPGSDSGPSLQFGDEDHPYYYTLQFNIGDLRAPAGGVIGANQTVLTRARIIWTVAGNSVERLINIGKGSTISGLANNANLKIFDYSVLNEGSDPGILYNVSAQVAVGTRPYVTNAPPTLVTENDVDAGGLPTNLDVRGGTGTITILNGATQVIAIPQEAGVVGFYTAVQAVPLTTAITPVNVHYRISSGPNGNGTNLTGFYADPNHLLKWIPIHPSSRSILVTNNEAVPIVVFYRWAIEG